MMNDKIDIIVAGIGGTSAMNEVYKKHKKNKVKISRTMALFMLVRAFFRGAIVTWGVLGIVTHYISWIGDWHIKVFLSIVVGQISLMILNYIEVSFSTLAVNFIQGIPRFTKMIFDYYFTKKK